MRESITHAVTAVSVVVPAHDEEQLLGRCLTAIEAARTSLSKARPDLQVLVVVVLDACGDGSADVARDFGVHVVESAARCVGTARALGVARTATLLDPTPPNRTWIACTDADSVVPPDWLTHQVAAAESGADLVLGRVRPDPRDLDPATRQLWWEQHLTPGAGLHVHGANLGVRLDAYTSAGGFEPVHEHEDVLLANRLCARGIRPAPGREVVTSGRLLGRVEGGFAGYLRGLHVSGDPVAWRDTGARPRLEGLELLVERSQDPFRVGDDRGVRLEADAHRAGIGEDAGAERLIP